MEGAENSCGKAASIARSLAEHAEAFRAFVRARVPREEVDDILQTAALRAIEHSGSLRNTDRTVAWLYRIHRNVIADTLRSRARSERLFETNVDELPPHTDRPPEMCRCSLKLLKRMRPSYASILAQVDAGGDSLRDAAYALGISVQNATVRLHRARKALRKVMLEHCRVESIRDCLDCHCGTTGCCPI